MAEIPHSPPSLIALFERCSEAHDSISTIRLNVLRLAVRGVLTRSEPSDQPVSDLLAQIEQTRGATVSALGTRQRQQFPPVEQDEQSFALPDHWTWGRLGNLGAVVGGGTPPSSDPECFAEPGEGIPWITPADCEGGSKEEIERGRRDLTEKGLKGCSAKLMPAGTVLFTSRAPIGYTSLAANEISTNQGFKSVVPFVIETNAFLALYLRASAGWITNRASGTTFPEVSGKVVSHLPVPIPPLAEQKRIVAKVEELMGLCDELEAAQAERERQRERLHAGSLHRLQTAPDDEVLRSAARFHFQILPRVTVRPEQIAPLRQTILDLAVRGKLVEQDERESSKGRLSDQLLEVYDQSKALGGKGESKPSRVPESNTPFSIPPTWEWLRLMGFVPWGKGISYGIIKLGDEPSEGGVPVLRCSNVRFRRIDLHELRRVEPELSEEYNRTVLEGGELLVNVRGTLGGCSLVPDELKGFNVAREVAVVPLSDLINRRFILDVISSPYFQNQVTDNLRGIAYKGLNLSLLRQFPIPLPPLAEQHRIVAKVDELMVLCDELEASLTRTQTESRRLLDAVMAEIGEPETLHQSEP